MFLNSLLLLFSLSLSGIVSQGSIVGNAAVSNTTVLLLVLETTQVSDAVITSTLHRMMSADMVHTSSSPTTGGILPSATTQTLLSNSFSLSHLTPTTSTREVEVTISPDSSSTSSQTTMSVSTSSLTTMSAPTSSLTTMPAPTSSLTTMPAPTSSQTTMSAPTSSLTTMPVSTSSQTTMSIPASSQTTMPVSTSSQTTMSVPASSETRQRATSLLTMMSPTPTSKSTSDSSTNPVAEYLRKNPAEIVLALALLIAIIVIIVCGGVVYRQRKFKKDRYDIPTVDHGLPRYSLPPDMTVANENAAVYEKMPGGKAVNMGMSTETFRRAPTTPQTNIARDEQNADSMYELDDEVRELTKKISATKVGRAADSAVKSSQTPNTEQSVDSMYELDDEIRELTKKISATNVATAPAATAESSQHAASASNQGLYEMDDVDTGPSDSYIEIIADRNPLLKKSLRQEESFYEMDDQV